MLNIWCCPYCQTSFENDFHCKSCNITFPVIDNKPDLRVTKPIDININYKYTPEFGYFPWDKIELEWPHKKHHFKNIEGMDNMELSMLSTVEVGEKNMRALDFGCGPNKARFKQGLELLGYSYIGIDIEGPAPTVYGDAHCLPFKNETFDLIMSSAVFEHLKNPFVAMKELYRVAKPNAKIVISIAYNEPFHISYFHHSLLAAHELLVVNDLHPDKFIVSNEWNSFNSNLNMGFAGTYIPAFIQKIISNSIRGFALLPARTKGLLKNDRSHVKAAKLAFARSHSGYVGVLAHKKPAKEPGK